MARKIERSMPSVTIIGVHAVPVSDQLFRDTVEWQWSADLSGDELTAAENHVREHFAGLYLLEAELDPPDADFDWGTVTQETPRQPRQNWQVPYDERALDEEGKRWAFFLHYVRLDRPLETPRGPVALPAPSSLPDHLQRMLSDNPYEPP